MCLFVVFSNRSQPATWAADCHCQSMLPLFAWAAAVNCDKQPDVLPWTPCTRTMAKAFITSRLDCCNSLYHGITDELMRRLQSAQNAAARLITGRSVIDSRGEPEKSQKVTRGSHRNAVSPLTQGLRYRSASDNKVPRGRPTLLLKQASFCDTFCTCAPYLAYTLRDRSCIGLLGRCN